MQCHCLFRQIQPRTTILSLGEDHEKCQRLAEPSQNTGMVEYKYGRPILTTGGPSFGVQSLRTSALANNPFLVFPFKYFSWCSCYALILSKGILIPVFSYGSQRCGASIQFKNLLILKLLIKSSFQFISCSLALNILISERKSGR